VARSRFTGSGGCETLSKDDKVTVEASLSGGKSGLLVNVLDLRFELDKGGAQRAG